MDAASRNLVGHKVKTAPEIARLIGPLPREKKVIMCHGTFDIVHPGHVRHLLYAKSKAAILIASLTADEHIMKANFRPFVPQDLRAFNLAALECVDYVLIDADPKPLKNIAIIQPDYFAKGYEYTKSGLNPRTAEEQAVVTSYGGEVIFTPGDVVYSSSHIIETDPPAIATEKLMALLDAEKLSFDDLRRGLREIRRLQGARDRRHDHRQLHAVHHDRRHDQDADDERALRGAAGLRRRRRHRRDTSESRRRRRDVLDGARPRQARTICARHPAGRRRQMPADHRPDAADHEQERDRSRRLSAAQGRQG